jgi:secreted trypsin-like serine protease
MRMRLMTVAVLVGAAGLLLPLAGVASARVTPAVPVQPTWTKHPNCIITPSPSTFVETGLGATASSVAFVLQVECKPVFGEQQVEINAQQLSNACHGTLSWYSATATDGTAPGTGDGETFNVYLDDDGNATAVVWGGPSCAATRDLITADLTVAPYTTVKTHVTIEAPVTTPTSLHVYPGQEVEDATTSSVAAIFYAELPSVYAENSVEFSDAQLYDRCTGGITWVGPDEVILGTGKSVTTTLDDNGNAWVVALAGPSCASGETLAQADLVGPTYKTLTTHFRVLSPRVTVTG